MKNILFITATLFLFSCSNSTQQNKSDDNNVDSTKSVFEKVDTIAAIETEANTTKETTKEEPEYIWDNSIRVYINDPDPGATNVRSSPGGDILYQLPKDQDYEIHLIGTKNGWFITNYIENLDYDSLSYKDIKGYIHGSVLSAETRNYGGEKIYLYPLPSSDYEPIGTIYEEEQVTLVDGCEDGNWIYIRYNDGGVQFEGWILSKWLCGSLRTNCS